MEILAGRGLVVWTEKKSMDLTVLELILTGTQQSLLFKYVSHTIYLWFKIFLLMMEIIQKAVQL